MDPKTAKYSRQKFKFAYQELYLSTILIQNYQSLNWTGFRKILKKHDKLMETDWGLLYRREVVDAAPFSTDHRVELIIDEIETVFINQLEGGNRSKAMSMLRVPPFQDKNFPLSTFLAGFFAASNILLVILNSLAAAYSPSSRDWTWFATVYRAPILLFVFLLLLGVNVYGWERSGVNHVLIFELNPRDHLSHIHYFVVAGFFGVFVNLSVAGWLMNDFLSVDSRLPLLLLWVFALVFLLNPFPVFLKSSRFWLARNIVRIFSFGLFAVNFADFWLADQLTSLTEAIVQLELFVLIAQNVRDFGAKSWSFYFLLMIPYLIRMGQCLRRFRDTKKKFPHLVNAGKYFSTIVAIVAVIMKHKIAKFPPFFTFLAIFTSLVKTLYSLAWDYWMDWSIFNFRGKTEHFLLRSELIYQHVGVYYFGIVENFVCRFAWVWVRIFGASAVTRTVLGVVEVFRRFVWNYFRLENEHLNNCGEFRAVRDISIGRLSREQ